MCALVPTVADQFGLSGVWLTIAFMGAVQGPLFPTSSVYLSRWMPGKGAPNGDEKAWGTSMLDIGISLGSLLIIPTANTLADAVGWRGTYSTVGAHCTTGARHCTPGAGHWSTAGGSAP